MVILVWHGPMAMERTLRRCQYLRAEGGDVRSRVVDGGGRERLILFGNYDGEGASRAASLRWGKGISGAEPSGE